MENQDLKFETFIRHLRENEKKRKVEENQGTVVFWILKISDENVVLLTPSVVPLPVIEDFYMLFFSFYAYQFLSLKE